VGTTLQGGNGFGTLFTLRTLDQTTWKQDVVHRFYASLDGIFPVGQLTKDSHGDLFGVTVLGGGPPRQQAGMVFELQPNPAGPWKETILYDFSGGLTGRVRRQEWFSIALAISTVPPSGGGTGTMCEDGSGYCGTVYEITP